MKRISLLLVCSILLRVSLFAADNAPADPADVEDLKRLVGKVQDMEEASSVQQRKIADLAHEVESLRAALRDANEKSERKMAEMVSREDLKRLAEKLQEIDHKREEDRKVILDKIKEIPSIVAAQQPVAPAPRPSRTERSEVEKPEKKPAKVSTGTNGTFYSYTVKKGESLSEIIAAYNTDFKAKGKEGVTLDQVRKANPKININRIYEGQEITIPDPPEKK